MKVTSIAERVENKKKRNKKKFEGKIINSSIKMGASCKPSPRLTVTFSLFFNGVERWSRLLLFFLFKKEREKN